MVSKKVKVVNSQGFHMRPVTAFVGAMGKYGSDVKIVSKGNEINGKCFNKRYDCRKSYQTHY